jgi:hypothetical protein
MMMFCVFSLIKRRRLRLCAYRTGGMEGANFTKDRALCKKDYKIFAANSITMQPVCKNSLN